MAASQFKGLLQRVQGLLLFPQQGIVRGIVVGLAVGLAGQRDAGRDEPPSGAPDALPLIGLVEGRDL